MLFDREDLQDLLWSDVIEIDGKTAKTVRDDIIDTTRWSIVHELVFSYDGKFYQTTYSVGATEQQDESPFQYEDDQIDCTEVEPVEVTKIEYRPVKG